MILFTDYAVPHLTGTLARVIECLPTTACCYWLEMSVAFDVLWPIFCFHSVWQWQQQLLIKDCDSPGRFLVASTATVTLTGTMLCSLSELYLRPNLSETVFTCLESCFYIYISSRFFAHHSFLQDHGNWSKRPISVLSVFIRVAVVCHRRIQFAGCNWVRKSILSRLCVEHMFAQIYLLLLLYYHF